MGKKTKTKTKMKVRKLSIRHKILIPVLILVIVACSLLSITSYQQMQTNMIEMGVDDADMAAKIALKSIDGDLLKEIETDGEDSEAYETVRKAMQGIQKDCGIKYLYTLYAEGNKVYYGVDADALNPNDMGEVFEVSYEELSDVFKGKEFVQDFIDHTEDGDLVSVYKPIFDSTGKQVGVLGCDYDAGGVVEKMNKMVTNLIPMSIGCVVIVIILVVLTVNSIMRGMKKIQVKMYDLVYNKGDLTQKLDIRTGDELELIADRVNDLLDYIRQIMLNIAEASNNLNDSAKNIADHMLSAEDNISDVSATMEEMSAAMEESTASLSQVNGFVVDVYDSIGKVTEKSLEAQNKTESIQENANQVCEEAREKQSVAKEQAEEMNAAMQEKISRSKAVQEITTLTDNIIAISAQTNLLALNANIEAARAGEAGRGFAVVADEIATLASNSAQTAQNIQAVSANVIEAVEQLAEEAEKMVTFTEEMVLDGYSKLVKTGEDYREMAVYINTMMSDFTESAKQLEETMNSIKQAAADVNLAVEESAKGVTNVAEMSSDLTESISNVCKEADDNKNVAGLLIDEVNKFKLH